MYMGIREERVMHYMLHGVDTTSEVLVSMADEEISMGKPFAELARQYLEDRKHPDSEAWRKLIQATLCRLVRKEWITRVERSYYEVTDLGREKYYTALAIRCYKGGQQ